MHVPLLLFAAAATAIIALWSWLGAPVAMPPSPVAAGEKLYCVSYAPFRDSENPLDPATYVAAARIEQDLARLAKVTSCVRTYSVEHGLDQLPPIAAKYGLQVLQGIWLYSDPARTQKQLDIALPLINLHPKTIRAVIVGNEVLLRGEMSGSQLSAVIRRVKAAVTVPVTYADIWDFWLRNREVAGAVDFITIHILPYWEDFSGTASATVGYVEAIRQRMIEAFPGREILIGEIGWPSAGRMRERALPSPVNQALVLHQVVNAAKTGNYNVNLIEAYDQPWKRLLEGTVGGHWGLFDGRTREPKFTWGEPVSNHPHWVMQAAAGVALAALVFIAAFLAAAGLAAGQWLRVSGMAVVAGAMIGLTLENIPLESFGLGGWLRSLTLGLIAVGAPPIAAAALATGTSAPSFARLLGGIEGGPANRFAMAVGWALVLLSGLAVYTALGLVFDHRYKDLPYAPLAAPVLSYFILAFSVRARPEEGGAERIAAVVLGLGAIYLSLNEGFGNWQAQSLAGLQLLLALTLVRRAGVRRPAPKS